MDQAQKGSDALAAGKHSEAIQHFTTAIKSNPNAVNYYVQRSTAYQRSSPADNKAALSDAEIAVVLAHKRGSRELITKAQLRRAIALFNLERYGDAEYVFGIVKSKDPKENSLPIWEMKLKKKLAELDEGDERGVLSAKEIPEVDLAAGKKEEVAGRNGDKGTPSSSNKELSTSVPQTAVVQTPVDKIKHEWYQNNEYIFFSLLAKGIPKDKAFIDIQDQSLSISFPTQTGSTYDFSLEPLFAPIDPAQSTSNVMSTKVEIKLKKITPGIKWKGLEGDGNEPAGAKGAAPATSQLPINSKSAAAAPSYPTSSKSGPKDWDKLADDLSKAPKKSGDADARDDGWEEDDLEGGDEVNNFFKKLYKNADPDTRRAMMKSYQESNGTALSTNWSEVSKGTVETSPPDGMVAKKWGG